MNLVTVNTSRTGNPTGRWRANPNRARAADYLVEESHGRLKAVYNFSGVSKRNAKKRFIFKGLCDVTNTRAGKYIKKNLDVSRARGEANPVRYSSL